MVVAFFFVFFCCQQLGHGDGRAGEEIEREKCKEKERRRVVDRGVKLINFFGFRNKYGMY